MKSARYPYGHSAKVTHIAKCRRATKVYRWLCIRKFAEASKAREAFAHSTPGTAQGFTDLSVCPPSHVKAREPFLFLVCPRATSAHEVYSEMLCTCWMVRRRFTILSAIRVCWS